MTDLPINDASFMELLASESLQGSACEDCGAVYVPPRSMCPSCHSGAMEWRAMSGAGTLIGFTSISLGPPWMEALGYDRKNPYCVGVVKLDEGPRVVARIEGVNAAHPEEIEVGTPLQIQFGRSLEDPPSAALVFRPAE